MAYKLVCVHPFGEFVRGQIVTDAEEVAQFSSDRENHFVRVLVPDEPVETVAVPAVRNAN